MVKLYDDIYIKEVAVFQYGGKRVNVPFEYTKEKRLRRMPNTFYFSYAWFFMMICMIIAPFGVILPFKDGIFAFVAIIVIGSLSNLFIKKQWDKPENYQEILIRDHEKEIELAKNAFKI